MVAAAVPTMLAVRAEKVNLHYGTKHALKDIDFDAPARQVTALIGPSGCGKSSFLRCFNRMNDRIPNAKVTGKFEIAGMDPYAKNADLMRLRRAVGMLFQKPNPFPSSVFENIALAPSLHYGVKGSTLEGMVEEALKRAALWDEVKDHLKRSALELSGGQQQRLCLARMLAVEPEVLLMDEPCSALDPISTGKIEELIAELAKDYTVLIVTHNLQQAHRVSQRLAFFMLGELVELGDTERVFEAAEQSVTRDYLSGRFG